MPRSPIFVHILLFLAWSDSCLAQTMSVDKEDIRFNKQVITREFISEGVAVGDADGVQAEGFGGLGDFLGVAGAVEEAEGGGDQGIEGHDVS